jgi:hypothetical protein
MDLRHTASGELANDSEPISIKGAGCEFGGCVRRGVEFASGELCVAES